MLFTVLFNIKTYVKLNKYFQLVYDPFGQYFENVPVKLPWSSKFYMQPIIFKILTLKRSQKYYHIETIHVFEVI